MALTAKDVVQMVKDKGVKMIDFKFIDLPGIWQHYSIPAHRLTEDLFEEGIGFDGSSIRGFAQIQESDMLVFPDPESAFVDPLLDIPTLSLTCNVRDPLTLEPFSRDPRYIAIKAEKYLGSTGIGDILTGVRRPSSIFSTTFASIRGRTSVITFWIRARASGIPARTRNRTWAIGPGTRKDTSRFRPWTHSRTCAARSC